MSANEETAQVIAFPAQRVARDGTAPAAPPETAGTLAPVIELAAFRASASTDPTPDRAA